MSADFTAFGRVRRLSRRRGSVKRTGNGLPQSGRMASDSKKSTTQRKPTSKRRKSRSSSRKLNSIKGEWAGSGEGGGNRRGGIGGGEGYTAARERLPQHGTEIGNLPAGRIPGRFALKIDAQITGWAARDTGRQPKTRDLKAA